VSFCSKDFPAGLPVRMGRSLKILQVIPRQPPQGVAMFWPGFALGLLGQGLTPLEAAVVGMYLGGMASDTYHETFGGHTLMASDLLIQIPVVLGKLYPT